MCGGIRRRFLGRICEAGGYWSLFLLCSLGGGRRWAPHLPGAESEVWGTAARCRRWWGRALGLSISTSITLLCAMSDFQKPCFLYIFLTDWRTPGPLFILTHPWEEICGGTTLVSSASLGEERWKHCSHFYTIVFGLSIPINNLPPHPFAMDGALTRATKMLFLAGRQLQLRLWCELQARGWWCWWYIKLATPGRLVYVPTSK